MDDDHPQSRIETLKKTLPDRCPFSEHVLTAGPSALRYMKAEDLDPLLDQLVDKPPDDPDVVDERLPYWAEVWPAALLMATTILCSDTLPPGPWLEIGCGPGVAGVAAGMRNRPGCFTDYMPEAIDLAELNWRLNLSGEFSGRTQDWRQPDPALRSSWILATDVAYETRNFEPLLRCFDQLLLPGGEIWFAEAGRTVARSFFVLLEAGGWQRDILEERDGMTVSRLVRQSAS